jgi:2-oxoglutarate ferredoxin oxidoreductase subunit gamma
VETAKNEFHPRVFNIIILGAVVGVTGVISLEQARAAIEKKLGYKFEKQPELRDLNFKALQRGTGLIRLRQDEPVNPHIFHREAPYPPEVYK